MNRNVSVIGIGRIGLCLSLSLERAGYAVLGCDVRKEHLDAINNKTLRSVEPGVDRYLDEARHFRVTAHLQEAIEHSHVIFVMVKTYAKQDGAYDHSQIEDMIKKIQAAGKPKEQKCLVLCSNVYPGYTDALAERLKDLNYVLIFNPELVAQGRIIDDIQNPDVVIIGEENREGDRVVEMYKNMCLNDPKIHRMNRVSAELTKIAFNSLTVIKVSFANMIGDLAVTMGGSPDTILHALGDFKRFGKLYLGYGFGCGGPCLPGDNRAFIRCAGQNGIDAALNKAAGATGEKHLEFQCNEFIKTHDKRDRVIIEEVTYKKGVIYIDESQQLLFAVRIAKAGYDVVIRERREVIDRIKKIHGDLFTYEITN